MLVDALGKCHPDCRFCSIEWFRWWKGRDKAMSLVRKGSTVSFAEAALSSIKGD